MNGPPGGPTPDENPLAELKSDIPAERALLERAIGGWRGMIDSGLPSAVFIVVYAVAGARPDLADQRLSVSLWAAGIVAVLIAVLRLIRRESLQQVFAGLVGVGVSAYVAARTGQAEDYFLPGLLTNVAYGVALLVSVLVGWPLIGVAVGFLTGGGTAWRHDPSLRRVYGAATWVWVGVFAARLVVQVPLYLAAAVGPLGVAKIIMGWPLFLLAAYVTYRLLKPVLATRDAPEDEAASP